MKMQNGAHTAKKKNSGGFIRNTFIISKDDTPQKKTGKILAIISLLLIVAAIVMGAVIISNYASAHKNSKDNTNLISSGDTSSIASSGDAKVSSTPDSFDEKGILSDLSELYKKNPETIGHVYIPGTKLDYVVAQGKDNEYYLNHTLDKKTDPYGTPFADHRATFSMGYQSKNVTIYGHNSKIGEFFESVKYYKDIEFYKKHPIVNFDTIYGKGQYKVIGRFTENVDEDIYFNYHDYYNFDPHPEDPAQNKLAEEIYNKFITELDKRNYYESGVDIKFGDNFLTLSTCNDEIMGAKNTHYRDVLVARKIRPGESATVDVEKIKPNTDMIMPKGWIEKFGKENPYK